MLFRVHLLHVDPVTSGSIRYFLMLAQMPEDGRMETRKVVEGAYMGYANADNLRESFVQSKINAKSFEQLERGIKSDSGLVLVGTLDLDSSQLRALGFLTLARMIEVLCFERQ